MREPFLRESGDFNINGSGVILRRLHDTLEGDQAGGQIDFDMGPHPGGTINNTFLQCTAGALMDVLNRENAFCFCDSGRVIGSAGLRLRRASAYYAGFVEMNVRPHHARCDEFTGQVQLFAHRLKGLSDGRDLAVIYENIERAIALASHSIRVSWDLDHEVLAQGWMKLTRRALFTFCRWYRLILNWPLLARPQQERECIRCRFNW